MGEIIGRRYQWTTHSSPLEAHLTHLRHLTKSVTAKMVLERRFGFAREDARATGRTVAAYVAEAIEFHTASRSAPYRIRPVLQYYAYLNLAVAVIETYRPANYADRTRHGVSDMTQSQGDRNIGIRTRIVRSSRGALPLFHDVLSSARLPERTTFRVIDLVAAIPMLAVELQEAFSLRQRQVRVTEAIEMDPPAAVGGPPVFRSAVSFQAATAGELPVEAALMAAAPVLAVDYQRHAPAQGWSPDSVTFRSVNHWPDEDAARAAHRALCRRVINYGGHDGPTYLWHHLSGSPLLPTATACMLFSFFLSSLFRYRARLAEKWQRSRLNILADAFINEADGVLIPTFRNLLYADEATPVAPGVLAAEAAGRYATAMAFFGV